MSQVFEILQERYRDLVRGMTDAPEQALLEKLQTFLRDARQGGASVADPGERSQLRAYMRFAASVLQESGKETPRIDLLPLDRERWPARPAARPQREMPPWFWALVGAAGLAVLAGLVAAAALALGGVAPRVEPTPLPSLPAPTATLPPTATPTPTPSPTPTPTSTPTPPPPRPPYWASR